MEIFDKDGDKKICKGSWGLGNNCGKCYKCEETKPFVDIEITVKNRVHKDTNKRDVSLLFPRKQEALTPYEVIHNLISGVCLMIKSSSKANEDGTKDDELMQSVIKHLNHEFENVESFKDLKFFNNKIKKND